MNKIGEIETGERMSSFERAKTKHVEVASPKQQSNEAHNLHKLSSCVFLPITSDNLRPLTQFMTEEIFKLCIYMYFFFIESRQECFLKGTCL